MKWIYESHEDLTLHSVSFLLGRGSLQNAIFIKFRANQINSIIHHNIMMQY